MWIPTQYHAALSTKYLACGHLPPPVVVACNYVRKTLHSGGERVLRNNSSKEKPQQTHSKLSL